MAAGKSPWPDLQFDTTSTCLFHTIDPTKCLFLRGRLLIMHQVGEREAGSTR